MRRQFLVFVIAAVVQTGCGSDSGSPTGPQVGGDDFSQTITGSVGVFSETRHPFTIPRSGDFTLRLTWGDATVDLDLYLANASCSVSLYPLTNCDIAERSIAANGTSETIFRRVTSGQEYQIWVDNLSTTTAMNYTLSIEID